MKFHLTVCPAPLVHHLVHPKKIGTRALVPCEDVNWLTLRRIGTKNDLGPLNLLLDSQLSGPW